MSHPGEPHSRIHSAIGCTSCAARFRLRCSAIRPLTGPFLDGRGGFAAQLGRRVAGNRSDPSGCLDGSTIAKDDEGLNYLGKLEWALSLHTAVERFEELRTQEATVEGPGPSLPMAEALEVLALSEVITRKVRYGQRLSVRTARTAGASWADIGRSLGVSRQAAWESHMRWMDGREAQHRASDTDAFDGQQISQARIWAGGPAE